MSENLVKFRSVLLGESAPAVPDSRLLMDSESELRIYYAPFEYVNAEARIILLGITPGTTQMRNSYSEFRRLISGGKSDSEALRELKAFASFSGEPMRTNLIKQLDAFGVHEWLKLKSSAELFSSRSQLVHTTSCVRFPTFIGESMYSGRQPLMQRSTLLKKYIETFLVDELNTASNAIVVSLGPKVAGVLEYLVGHGLLDAGRVVNGLPHPSGNNQARINWLLGDRISPEPAGANGVGFDRGKADFANRFL